MMLSPLRSRGMPSESSAKSSRSSSWGGAPAAGVPVRLRDTTGTLQPSVRLAVSDADGSFAFDGLFADDFYAVSASVERDGRTWSAQRLAIQPDTVELELELRDEDPVPPHLRGPDRARGATGRGQ